MRFLVRLIIFLAVLAGLLYGGSFLISPDIEVVRTKKMLAAPTTVFPLVNNLEHWEAWSPWLEADPGMKMEYGGPPSGLGASSTFTTSKGEEGNVKITASVAPKTMTYRFQMGDWAPSQGTFKLKPVDDGTEVEWVFQTRVEDVVGKYMMLLMKGRIASDFDRGLDLMNDHLNGNL